MAITDFTDGIAANINWGGGVSVIAWFFLFVVVVGVVGFIAYIVIANLKFNQKIIIIEEVAGQGFTTVGSDRAMRMKFGDSGEEVLHLKQRKLYRNAYGKKMGPNTYWFVIGSDGYWYNVKLGDFNKRLRELGVDPIDKDVRLTHVAIRKNIKDRFEKHSFMEKYLPFILNVGAIAIILILNWLLFDKYLQVAHSANAAVAASKDVLEAARQVISGLNQLKGTGAFVPAP